jgi:hypothetical protein
MSLIIDGEPELTEYLKYKAEFLGKKSGCFDNMLEGYTTEVMNAMLQDKLHGFFKSNVSGNVFVEASYDEEEWLIIGKDHISVTGRRKYRGQIVSEGQSFYQINNHIADFKKVRIRFKPDKLKDHYGEVDFQYLLYGIRFDQYKEF